MKTSSTLPVISSQKLVTIYLDNGAYAKWKMITGDGWRISNLQSFGGGSRIISARDREHPARCGIVEYLGIFENVSAESESGNLRGLSHVTTFYKAGTSRSL